jgi:glucose/arabinose dehydrogenase
MKPTTFVVASLGILVASAAAADATRPIDYTRRNASLAPGGEVTLQQQKPVANPTVQDNRVDKRMVEIPPSSLGTREAAVEVKESRPKRVREKDARRPEVVEQAASSFDDRLSRISTATDAARPPLVARYQDSLAAASATNMARFPAAGRATSAKIKRFVFRRNPSEPASPVNGSRVVPAAGGGVPRR